MIFIGLRLCCCSLLIGAVLLSSLPAGSMMSESREHTIEGGNQSPSFVWPISGTTTPDLPQSSAYGPRLQAGRQFAYDYHQGLDLPTPISTTLVAVMTGTVRIAGSHPRYSDGVVQLDHGNDLYSNYLHIQASLVITGQLVGIGEPVALSGSSASGFPHLHFEIRQGGTSRAHAINPLRYLPYTDTVSHTISITDILPTNAVWVQVSAPAYELDINRVTLVVRELATNRVVDQRVLDYEERNRMYNGDPDLLDIPDLDDILIQPHRFTSSSDLYVVDVNFHDLAGVGPVEIEACAVDVHENAVCSRASGTFYQRIYLPTILVSPSSAGEL
ncbi:MAG: hypothetical protein KatS3mg057_0103 [Herpetosiphonaceae bacterium]|nr:MAG: hypothetical protein KatS3mg057_0103 [Herpetosiphonaceae bacterium]